ncbi:putative glycine hydroxymethyltransferase [Helianthus debilis subsp. tardiflorus]
MNKQNLYAPGFKAYVTSGSENHLVLWHLRPLGLTGNKVEKLCANYSTMMVI